MGEPRSTGFGYDSQLAVARLGRSPASRFCVLAKHRSGLRFPTQASGLLIPHKSHAVQFVRDGRIELPLTVWKTVVLPLN